MDHYIESTDAFLVVYSILSRPTVTSTRKPGERMVELGRAKSLLILIGNKCDLDQTCPEKREVPKEEDGRLAKEMNCEFMGTSAKHPVNVESAFFEVARWSLRDDRRAQEVFQAGKEELKSGGESQKEDWRRRFSRLFRCPDPNKKQIFHFTSNT